MYHVAMQATWEPMSTSVLGISKAVWQPPLNNLNRLIQILFLSIWDITNYLTS